MAGSRKGISPWHVRWGIGQGNLAKDAGRKEIWWRGQKDSSFLLEGSCFTPSNRKRRLGCGYMVFAGVG